MIRTLTTEVVEIRRDDHVRRYLLGLAALCMEVATQPRLLPTFIAIIRLVPRTIEGQREAAAGVHRVRMRCYDALDLMR